MTNTKLVGLWGEHWTVACENLCCARSITRQHKMYHNGSIGVKLNPPLMKRYDVIVDEFAPWTWVRIMRRDILAQSFSCYRALNTGQWKVRKNEKIESVEFNKQAILDLYRRIILEYRWWDEFFYERRVFPYTIYYEDLLSNTVEEVRRLCDYLVGVRPKAINEGRGVISRDELQNAEWRQQFTVQDLVVV